MKIKNKIKLRFKNDVLNQDPEIKRWLRECEKIINKKLKDDHLEFISLDYATPFGSQVAFTTKQKHFLFYPQIIKKPLIYYPDLIVSID